MNNIRKLTAAAIIALATTTAAFAQNSSYIDPNSIDPATINTWAQLNVGSSTTASTSVNISSLSIADQFHVTSQDDATLDKEYKIVSVEGSSGLTVSMNNSDFEYCAQLVNGNDGQKLRFNFLVENNSNVTYGAHVLKVTLENTATHEQTSVILMVTVN
jgi:hypothetical protein